MGQLANIQHPAAFSALQYGAIGWAPIPIKRADKTPLLHEWERRATPLESTIRDHWRRLPKAGIGIHCGISGLAVIDVDARNGGLETLKAIEAEHGPLRRKGCLVARSGGGGLHFVFLAPDKTPLPHALGPGVDLLHGNRYFIVAPSVHPTGQAYEWEQGRGPFDPGELDFMAPLPEWACTLPQNDSNSPAEFSDPLDALANLSPQPLEDTRENRERVKSAADALSADCDYQEWMRRVFAILSTGLPDAEEIAREWSMSAPDRFDDRAFTTLVGSYKDDRRHGGDLIGPGTLFHLAKEAGWTDPKARKAEDRDDLDVTFRLIPAHEFANTGPVSWLVRSLIQREGLGVIYGEPGSGKSFLVLDLSGAVALGEEWRGLAVAGGPVVYIAAEGAGGFRKRLQALALDRGVNLERLPLWILADAPDLLRDQDKALARDIRAAGGAALIVVDTLASVTPGGNENSGEDMGAVIARCKRLQAETGAFVMLVHHSGKDAGRGARGWSGLKAAVDVEIEVTRSGEDRAARVTKQKEGEDGAVFPFRLKTVDLGLDAEGNPASSCVVEHTNDMPERGVREPSGTVQKIVFQVVKDFGPGSVDDVLKKAVDRMVHDPEKKDKRREHARRALENLLNAKFLAKNDDGVIRLHGDTSPDWDVDADDDGMPFEGD